MSLDELKNRIKEFPISEVIGRYLSVKRHSSNHIALCPFHGDTKPSLHINDKMGIYKCFACEASGDSIQFVREYKRLDYIEALKELCQQFGINYDDYDNQKKEVSPKEKMMRKLLVTANQLFQKMAQGQPQAYQDFLKQRNLTEEVAHKFSLGLTTKSNMITSYLQSIPDQKKRAEALKAAEELVLIKRSTHSGQSHYDTFRERIIFPIWDQFGHIVGFGGRDYGGNTPAKYLNSSDSMIFKKSNHLYGLNFAKNSIREHNKVLIVEGYMDVVALHRYGFDYAVGVMGVALGDKRSLTLKNLTPNIFLGLDSDNAGFKAMKRINQELLSIGVLPRYISYAPDKDPDDFMKSQGSLKMQEKMENAPLFLDVEVEQLITDRDAHTIDQKLQLLHEIFELLTPLGTNLMANELAIQYAKQLGINSTNEQIANDYKQFYSQKQKKSFRPEPAVRPPSSQSTAAPAKTEQTREELPASLSAKEQMIIEEIVAHPETLKSDKLANLLDFSSHPDVKQFVWELKEFLLEIDDSQYHKLVMNFASGDLYSLEIQQAVSKGLFKYVPSQLNDKVIERILSDLEFKLREEKLLGKKEIALNQQRNAQTSDEKTDAMKLIHQLDKELQQLKSEHRKR